METKLTNLVKELDLNNCSGLYLSADLELNEFGIGVDLECIEGSVSVEAAVEYLLDCF